MNDAEDESRQTVLRTVKMGNADLALKLLERIDPRLAPPAQRVIGKVDGQVTHRYVVELPLETEGMDSLSPEQVLGRDLGALPKGGSGAVQVKPQPEAATEVASPLATGARAAKSKSAARAQLERLHAERKMGTNGRHADRLAAVELPDETEGVG